MFCGVRRARGEDSVSWNVVSRDLCFIELVPGKQSQLFGSRSWLSRFCHGQCCRSLIDGGLSVETVQTLPKHDEGKLVGHWFRRQVQRLGSAELVHSGKMIVIHFISALLEIEAL